MVRSLERLTEERQPNNNDHSDVRGTDRISSLRPFDGLSLETKASLDLGPHGWSQPRDYGWSQPETSKWSRLETRPCSSRPWFLATLALSAAWRSAKGDMTPWARACQRARFPATQGNEPSSGLSLLLIENPRALDHSCTRAQGRRPGLSLLPLIVFNNC